MNVNLQRIVTSLTILVVVQFLVLSTFVQAEEVGIEDVADAAVAVNVIVNINKESRAITLKNDEGGEWVFTAGPEVRNFDQLKRGDLVIMAYYSSFAIALEPKGGLEERAHELSVSRAKAGEKPGMKVTDRIYVQAKITAIDKKDRTVTLQGPERKLTLKVGDVVDLNKVEVGQDVDAIYTESYAVSVVPGPKVSGTVTINIKALAFGIGVEWGEGTFSMYDGTSHNFKVKGVTVADIGISKVMLTGDVYNLVEAKDLNGTYLAGEAGAALVGGGSALVMENDKKVVLKLKSTQEGLRLTLAGEGLSIALKNSNKSQPSKYQHPQF